jgi:hypothetical protein
MGDDVRPIRPTRATADTELLGDPTCRRFVTALWEIAGGQLLVTPTVADELPGNVRMSEGRYWEDVLAYEREKGNQHYDGETYRRIIAATKEAADAWMRSELRGEGSGALVTAAGLDAETTRRVREIADRIPRACFRRPDQVNQKRDARIIGEAVTLGFTLLSTQNLGTIKDERTNDWLMAEGYARAPLITTIAQATRALYPAMPREPAALQAVLGAAMPEADRGIERDLRAVNTFIERLTTSHAKECAVWARDGLEELEHPGGMVRAVRQALPARTRAAEDTRLRETRRAAAGAGFRGFSP